MTRQYKSRAHQMRAFEREVRSGTMSLREALRVACMCGGVEERCRCLHILNQHDGYLTRSVYQEVISRSVLSILGYE